MTNFFTQEESELKLLIPEEFFYTEIKKFFDLWKTNDKFLYPGRL